ncbi:hypothetical protein Fcan01_26365 [Folsomia candida]|uniref:Protein kinase domain-containing protein n=1 Tax=Folsomia candida TaxID=158441 RepID=A0A226D1U7_FOLCA|nr:hypothetical protein Fcan01_26365 [Folsomia candida]
MAAGPDFLDTVAKYESFLGHGSFGFVLKAKHHDDTYSCIKFIYPTDDDKLKLQNERESSLTRKLWYNANIVLVKNSVCKKHLNPDQLKGESPCRRMEDLPKSVLNVTRNLAKLDTHYHNALRNYALTQSESTLHQGHRPLSPRSGNSLSSCSDFLRPVNGTTDLRRPRPRGVGTTDVVQNSSIVSDNDLITYGDLGEGEECQVVIQIELRDDPPPPYSWGRPDTPPPLYKDIVRDDK